MANDRIRFGIPDNELDDLRLLAHIKKEDFESLIAAIGEEKPTLDGVGLSKSVASRTNLPLNTVSPILSLLRTFATIQRRLGSSADAFLSDLSRILVQKGPEKWSPEDARDLDNRLESLKQALKPEGTLAYAAKAADLLLEQQSVFCRSRVITDMRPVFNEQADTIQGFLPFHTLAVRYHEGSETKETHIAMDFNDLVILRDQLTRAEQKERILASSMAAKGWLVIQTGADKDA